MMLRFGVFGQVSVALFSGIFVIPRVSNFLINETNKCLPYTPTGYSLHNWKGHGCTMSNSSFDVVVGPTKTRMHC